MKHISTLVLLGACITMTARLPDYVLEGLVMAVFPAISKMPVAMGIMGLLPRPSFEYDAFWNAEVVL